MHGERDDVLGLPSYTVLAVAHDGELVCEDCLADEGERAVFYDEPDQDDDDGVSPVFVEELELDDVCGRCGLTILH